MGQAVRCRERHPVGIVGEVQLVEPLVGFLASPLGGLPDPPYDRNVEVARAQPAQGLGLLELLHPDFHVRMGVLEACQCGRNERVTGGQESAEPEHSAPQPGDGSQLVLRRGHVAEHGSRVPEQPSPRVRDADWPCRPIQERETKLALERRDMVGDDGLRVSELERRRREGAALGDGVESAKPSQVVHRKSA